MPITPEWHHIAVYAVIAALVLMLLQTIPFIGRIVRFVFSLGFLALGIFILIQQAPYQPFLANFTDRLGLDQQQVAGKEVRIRMAPDGHFWANVTVNGVKSRMLIDSGATVTALSEKTANAAGIDPDAGLVPVMLRTANGVAQARTGSIDALRLGTVKATNLKVVISPSFGDLNVIGMNFLSRLASWRVEGRTLVLTPLHPQPVEPETA